MTRAHTSAAPGPLPMPRTSIVCACYSTKPSAMPRATQGRSDPKPNAKGGRRTIVMAAENCKPCRNLPMQHASLPPGPCPARRSWMVSNRAAQHAEVRA
jgi:hypothetical protein